MKKTLSLILALTLVFSLTVPALAANDTEGTTVIDTTIGETYTIVIPDSTTITFGATSTSIGDIGLDAAQLEPGNQVTFTADLTAAGVGAMEDVLGNELAYVMEIDGTGTNTASFSTVTDLPVTIEITTAAWNAAPAGAYSDTITFTIGIEVID